MGRRVAVSHGPRKDLGSPQLGQILRVPSARRIVRQCAGRNGASYRSRQLQLQVPQSVASISVRRRARRSPNRDGGRRDSGQQPEGRCRPANSAAVHRLVDRPGKISGSVDDAGVCEDSIHLTLLSGQSRIHQVGDKAALTRPSFARCCSDPLVESSRNCDVLSHVRCHGQMIHTFARTLHTAHARISIRPGKTCLTRVDRAIELTVWYRGFISRLPLHHSLCYK